MTGRAIAVIGAGIVGCLIARELAARDPDATITVLDRDLVGSGVTRRSAGCPWSGAARRAPRGCRAFSHAYYAALQAADPSLPIHPVGAPPDPARSSTAPGRFLGYLPDHIGSEATGHRPARQRDPPAGRVPAAPDRRLPPRRRLRSRPR